MQPHGLFGLWRKTPLELLVLVASVDMVEQEQCSVGERRSGTTPESKVARVHFQDFDSTYKCQVTLFARRTAQVVLYIHRLTMTVICAGHTFL